MGLSCKSVPWLMCDVHSWDWSGRCDARLLLCRWRNICRIFQHVSSCVGFVKYEARRLLMPSSLCPHVLSTTQLRFTFLTLFLMFKSFSWPPAHISCLAVYSRWVWALLWQRFLRSSAWRWAQVDYSNLPCYRLLLFSVIVTATKVAQHGLILPTSVSV